jgi:hypothetical protein
MGGWTGAIGKIVWGIMAGIRIIKEFQDYYEK